MTCHADRGNGQIGDVNWKIVNLTDKEHNMGGQPDGPFRDNGPVPQDGSRNSSGKNRFWAGALAGALVTAFVGLIVVGMSAGIYHLSANG